MTDFPSAEHGEPDRPVRAVDPDWLARQRATAAAVIAELTELREALADVPEAQQQVTDRLTSWHSTAEILEDPELTARLTGPIDPDAASSLDEVIAQFGYDRAELETELERDWEEPAAAGGSGLRGTAAFGEDAERLGHAETPIADPDIPGDEPGTPAYAAALAALERGAVRPGLPGRPAPEPERDERRRGAWQPPALDGLGIVVLPGRCGVCGGCAEGFPGGEYWHTHETDCRGSLPDGEGRLMVHATTRRLYDEVVRLRAALAGLPAVLAEVVESDDDPGLGGEALDAWNAATVRAANLVRNHHGGPPTAPQAPAEQPGPRHDFAIRVAAVARACAAHLVEGGGGAAVAGKLRDLAELADQQPASRSASADRPVVLYGEHGEPITRGRLRATPGPVEETGSDDDLHLD